MNAVNREMLHVHVHPGRRGRPVRAAYPGIAAHLRACGPCDKDFETLLAAVRDAAD